MIRQLNVYRKMKGELYESKKKNSITWKSIFDNMPDCSTVSNILDD